MYKGILLLCYLLTEDDDPVSIFQRGSFLVIITKKREEFGEK